MSTLSFFSGMKFTKYLLFLFSLLPTFCSAQSLQTVKDLDQEHQKLMDKGVNMLGYTVAYYNKLDSLLNVVYNKLRQTLSPEEMQELKLQQRQWLKERDAYFKQLYRDTEKKFDLEQNEWKEVEYLSVYHPQILFVEERVIWLMKRLNNE
jgi:uncharacterized protein YecT (DUF1311 family)